MPIRSVRTAVFEFTCDRCNAATQVAQPPAEGLDDYGDDGAGHYHNDDPPVWRHNSEEWPPGWNELRLEGTPGRHAISYTLLCTACTTDLVAFIGIDGDDGSGSDDDDSRHDLDDDGPESVPEGAEGVGPGAPGKRWSVRNVEHVQSTSGDDADIEHVPPSALELVEALRERRTRVEARINSRRLCDGPLHIAGALQSCPHFAWMERADHHLCLACAHAYDQLKAPTPRADVCVCGHLRGLHVTDATQGIKSLAASLGVVCTCALDGGALCDCKHFRSELATTAETW